MTVLRTPDACFKRIPNYPFAPHYLDIQDDRLGTMRMHYVDEGPTDAKVTVLMLHGEPTWSFLYRFMIPICSAAGHRVIAPDLIGFGKSDKPGHIDDYSYKNHCDWLMQQIEQLDLKNIVLVCQDWGSLLGLRIATLMQERFAAIAVGNGFLPTGERKVPKAFKLWRAFARYSPWFPIAKIVDTACFKKLSASERKAYDAPFPSTRYKAGTRAFPRLVPTDYDMPGAAENREAWKVLEQWQKPLLTAFSNGDPIMRGGEKVFQKRVPGAQGQPHVILKGGHFVQEDAGIEFAQAVNALIAKELG